MTLKLEPMFKRSITYVEKDDTNLGDKVAMFGSQHEFGDMTWFPNEHKVLYRFDDRVPTNISGDGLYDYLAFRTANSVSLARTRRAGYLLKIGLWMLVIQDFCHNLFCFIYLCRGNSRIKK